MAARSTDTVYTTLFDQGWPDAPHRALRNSTVEPMGKRGLSDDREMSSGG
ncbi:MAG: hypothetical protein HY067_20680 [Betaproteobacteria bacterium]|nr:hypothetical protein [Betaproteobacteria bacterium]